MERCIRFIAKAGYIARGSIYITVGFMALMLAAGMGGEVTSTKGAIVEISQQRFGGVLLFALTVGLFCYTVWRVTQSIADPDKLGNGFKGLVIRFGLMMSAISHLFLGYWSARLLMFNDKNSSNAGNSFLDDSFGQWLMIGVAIILIVVGIAHVFKGVTSRFERYMDISGVKSRFIKPFCQFGLIARGVVYGIVGWIIIKSALAGGDSKSKGTEDALITLNNAEYGWLWLGLIALGLFAFGSYSILESRYRRIKI